MQNTKIVVPCYNEASRLQPEPFLAACREQPWLSFVFIDDGSTDDTFAVAQQVAKAAPDQMSALRLPANVGKAEAVRHGVLHALSTSAELVGFWDADLATPLYNIARFVQVLERPEIQLVMGSRVRLLGHQIKRAGARHYLGRTFATLAALSLRLPVYDTQCGAKLFRANDTFREVFAQPFELGWSFDVELLARFIRVVRRAGLDPEAHVVEVALEAWQDVAGSKLRLKHFPRIAWEVAKLILVARTG